MRNRITVLDNGFLHVFNYYSGLSAMYNPDGTFRHGNRTPNTDTVVQQYLKCRRGR